MQTEKVDGTTERKHKARDKDKQTVTDRCGYKEKRYICTHVKRKVYISWSYRKDLCCLPSGIS